MRSAALVLVIAAAALLRLLPAWAQESFQLEGDWWDGPAVETRHTTFVASFDSTENNNADYSRDMMEPAGWGMAADVEGLHGSATQLAHDGAYLQYRGGSSFQNLHGTLRMEVKGDALAGPKPFWLFDTRAVDRATDVVSRIGVKYEPGKLSLVFVVIPREYAPPQEIGRLDVEVGTLSTDDWHSVVASWDRASGTGWIALDGRGVTGPIDLGPVIAPAFAVFVGGSAYGLEVGGSAPAGVAIDDLVLYDVALPILDAEPINQLTAEDLELLPQAEAAARKTLDLLADLQNLGGWEHGYSWPTLIGASQAYRESILPDNYFINDDKGNSSMQVVQDFTYGYDVLGDARFVEVMTKTADFLLAGQSPEGFWSWAYFIRPSGVEGEYMETHAKIQDHVQSYPLFFLVHTYRLTGDERYMEAAMRTGKLFLRMQNPDGSYSHHYDASTGIGRTHTNLPQGGELNDGATNDAIDVLALMYHFTRDPAYVQALERVGGWLIEAQGDDIPLWGEQYDNEGNLVWARDFEPPAYSAGATQHALEALLEICRFSLDEQYVGPIREMIAWAERDLSNGMMYFYLEEGTGRPIAATRGSDIYHLDVPEELEAALTPLPGRAALGHWTFEQRDILSFARNILAAAEEGKPVPAEVTTESALQELSRARQIARDNMATQNEAGVWVKYDGRPTMPESGMLKLGSIGPYVQAVSWEVRPILRYIELARMALGEIPAERRGEADPRATAYPYADWYEVDWNANVR